MPASRYFPRSAYSLLPDLPGVYRFYGRGGELLYIGKAKRLKRRVASYFGRSSKPRRTRQLIRRIRELDFLVAGSELEALSFEADLIREHKPPFNVALVDDPVHLYLRLTEEDFPRLEPVFEAVPHREAFGPFSSTAHLRLVLELLDRNFQLRKRAEPIGKEPRRPCLHHQLGRCLAPCNHQVTRAEYAERVMEVQQFLQGDFQGLRSQLLERMERASQQLDFEWAARHRDRLQGLERVLERLQVRQFVARDQDTAAFAHGPSGLSMVVLSFRQSRLTDLVRHLGGKPETSTAQAFLDFLMLHYQAQPAGTLPRELLLPEEIPGSKALEEQLQQQAGRKVRLRFPSRRPGRHLVDLAVENATQGLELFSRVVFP